jgi:hypothetical protein
MTPITHCEVVKQDKLATYIDIKGNLAFAPKLNH